MHVVLQLPVHVSWHPPVHVVLQVVVHWLTHIPLHALAQSFPEVALLGCASKTASFASIAFSVVSRILSPVATSTGTPSGLIYRIPASNLLTALGRTSSSVATGSLFG